MKLRVAKKIVKAVCNCGPYRPGWYNMTQIEKALRIVERAYNRYSDHAMQERYGVPRMQGIIDKFHVLSKILEAAQKKFLVSAFPFDAGPTAFETAYEKIMKEAGPQEWCTMKDMPNFLNRAHRRSEN